MKLVDHDLSKNMYCFTEHVIADGTSGVDQSKKDPALLKMKSLRETKIIPKVIFEKEQFQKFVIQLSNKAKINMVGQTKHALARDYRLYGKQVKEILEKENIQLEVSLAVRPSPRCNHTLKASFYLTAARRAGQTPTNCCSSTQSGAKASLFFVLEPFPVDASHNSGFAVSVSVLLGRARTLPGGGRSVTLFILAHIVNISITDLL